jgi:hypothetical protein
LPETLQFTKCSVMRKFGILAEAWRVAARPTVVLLNLDPSK